jgi:hypothetical protein
MVQHRGTHTKAVLFGVVWCHVVLRGGMQCFVKDEPMVHHRGNRTKVMLLQARIDAGLHTRLTGH